MDEKDYGKSDWKGEIKDKEKLTQLVEEVTACNTPPTDFGSCISGSARIKIDPCKCVGVAEVNYDATENGKLLYVTIKATNLCPGRTLNVGVVVFDKGTPNIKAFKTVQFTPSICNPCSSATLGPICILVHDDNCRKVEYDINIIANYAGMCF
ncbi:hypothetical protein SAMN00017405_1767 [Desulfonispora thiosulfatigenes DSM 11270]|uniref:Uncharacterized protein n=1 Tax=Desulfonispora thiosulfatigenes DSM 11270 TaxID=656914 RepID=A0A1W1V405_DESTI|nr:hypothetical protein [Desulfonispora thiosulfatigenes]SMB87784.1 hypothetical protein SAMN00017405_1767 [Desulfonispora thiosulfatigenes DSM 11270]